VEGRRKTRVLPTTSSTEQEDLLNGDGLREQEHGGKKEILGLLLQREGGLEAIRPKKGEGHEPHCRKKGEYAAISERELLQLWGKKKQPTTSCRLKKISRRRKALAARERRLVDHRPRKHIKSSC